MKASSSPSFSGHLLLKHNSTDLPVDPRKDREEARGYSSKGKFYGYLHLVSTENSILLGFKVTVGNPVLRRTKMIEYLVGDAAYHSPEAMEVIIGGRV